MLKATNGVKPPAIYENGKWKEASPVLGHRINGEPWEGVERNTSFPQPAEALPEHHTPTKPNDPKSRYPNPASSAGGPSFTALLYQDEGIRVFENRIQPGLLGPKHRHDDDYWLCTAHVDPVGPDATSVTVQQDHPDPARMWSLVGAGKPAAGGGAVTFIKGGHTETADNPPENPLTILYAIEIMKPEGQVPAELPKGWGAASAVLYENTEVKISELRVPPGQTGAVSLLQNGTRQVFHVDVTGQRQGSVPMGELRAGKGLSFGRKKYGTTYAFKPGEKKAEAVNDGAAPYRGVVVEVKDVPHLITARL